MNGHAYGEEEPTEKCPYCGRICSADFVDIGVGFTQCGPYHCTSCGASEMGCFDEERDLSPDELRTGWYAPGNPPSDKANVIDGKIVDHRVMRRTYHEAFADNPRYNEAGVVEDWWKTIRGK